MLGSALTFPEPLGTCPSGERKPGAVSSVQTSVQTRFNRWLVGSGVLLVLGFAVLLVLAVSRARPPLATAQLADGRILRVEAVTFGTHHEVGARSTVERFQPWLPQKVNQFFAPKHPYAEINRDEPALVVWVNAQDAVTGTNVDCQRIRVEFVDENGELFGESTRHWFGGTAFWRVGHVFQAFPRTQTTLTLQVTPWKTNVSVRLQLPNPRVTRPADWSGQPLPQEQRVGTLDVVLSGLALRTNGGPRKRWETPSCYWEPIWELREDGKAAIAWDVAAWEAEDPTGNRGQHLGVHQPVLRFSVEVYPSATNLNAAPILGRAPEASAVDLQSNLWWNLPLHNGARDVLVLGLFPPGVHTFSEGVYQTNPAVKMGATRGGAPTGWVGSSKRLSPTKIQHWSGHYTPTPTIYIQAPALDSKEKLAVRLRDEQGRCWPAKPEPQGASQGIWPFIVELPPEVNRFTAEIVLLKSVQAKFTVKTGENKTP